MQLANIDYRKRICCAMNFISQNIERELSLEEIAESASFSAFHFHRIFKVAVGETVAGFTRRLRLESAANRLISNSGDDITTIAMDYGFSSSQNFAKSFRKHFGMTPTEYRNSKIGNIFSKNENVSMFQNRYNVDSVMKNLSNLIRKTTMDTEVKDIPECEVAYIRKMGSYGKETCESAFIELMDYAGPRNLIGPGKMLAIYWDNPEVTSPEKCRFDACIMVPDGTEPEGQICIQKIQGGPYAVHRAEVKPEEFPQAWQDAFVWLCNSGLEADDGPCLELYYNNAMEHPEGKWMIEICIPLKNKNLVSQISKQA